MKNARLCASESGVFVCGAKRSRTADLLNAIQALYQLSYSPGSCAMKHKRQKIRFLVLIWQSCLLVSRPDPSSFHEKIPAFREVNKDVNVPTNAV